MPRRAQEQFRRAAKGELTARRMSITTLARKINRSRTTVSLAINQGVFPATRELIATELGISSK